MCTIPLVVGQGTKMREFGRKESWFGQLVCARGRREGCFILNDQENITDSMISEPTPEGSNRASYKHGWEQLSGLLAITTLLTDQVRRVD